MVDNERILQRINIIITNIEELKKLQQLSMGEFVSSNQKMAAAKYFLQTSIEAILDIGNHIIARQRLGIPENSLQTLEILVQANILKPDNLETYRQMVKFRNLLVHLYHVVDSEKLYQIMQQNINDFNLFIRQILAYIQPSAS